MIIRRFILLFLLFPFPLQAVELGKHEAQACEAILCAVGIVIPASHDKCRQVLTDWSIYLATLGPFRKPPKCPMSDDDGKAIGEMDMDCKTIQDPELRQVCLDASSLPPVNECSGLMPLERAACECRLEHSGDPSSCTRG